MVGTLPLHSSTPISVSSSDESIHLCLLALAEQGNQSRPIVARLQSRPARLHALLGSDSPTVMAARGRSAYNFHRRPFQHVRPRPIRLDRFQTAAVSSELHRLRFECHAIEGAPDHDGDKALLTSAPAWERSSLRVGPWPRERKIPVFSQKLRVRLHDRHCKLQQSTRRQRGLTFRDFESPVFTVPKKDGAFRLCTDYRRLNLFQNKTTMYNSSLN
jgi:hypothetical protein